MPALSKKEGNELISTQTPPQMVTGMERETESHVQYHTYSFFLGEKKKIKLLWNQMTFQKTEKENPMLFCNFGSTIASIFPINQ